MYSAYMSPVTGNGLDESVASSITAQTLDRLVAGLFEIDKLSDWGCNSFATTRPLNIVSVNGSLYLLELKRKCEFLQCSSIVITR